MVYCFIFDHTGYTIRYEVAGMNETYHSRYIQLGLNIAYYRKLRGMTQMQLAEAVSLSRTHISNIEAPNMRCALSLDKLFEIADALETDAAKLLECRE